MTVNLVLKAKFKVAPNFATFENHQVISEHMSGGSRDRSHHRKLCLRPQLCRIFRMERQLFFSSGRMKRSLTATNSWAIGHSCNYQ